MTPEKPTSSVFTKEVWFVPGANATPLSFNYIKEYLRRDPELNDYAFVDITYDCQENLASVIKVMVEKAPIDKPFYIIGHSLGGVLAVAASQRIKHYNLSNNVKGIFTLSSPFGGSESADYLKWIYPNYSLFRNVTTTNKVITDLKAVGAVVPTTSLVTTSGNNPLYPTANDGVVTIKSQRALNKANYIEVPNNHLEVLLNKDTVDHIKIFLKR